MKSLLEAFGIILLILLWLWPLIALAAGAFWYIATGTWILPTDGLRFVVGIIWVITPLVFML